MDCLTDELLWAYLERTLPAPEVAAIESHLAGCAGCLELVAEGARLRFPDDPPPAHVASPALLRPGTRIGRYQVVAPRGAGAAGIVYEAHDPQLDRKVAIKLLRRATGEEGARNDGATAKTERERLLAEAQSMARLNHPHVVAIHDAGVHAHPGAEDEVFVVMELVDGETLAEWLAAAPRSWREILELFVQAGRGLAAVHAAQMVHRDFKPHNVLIGGDGRARVTDFGLARPPQWSGLIPLDLPPAASDPGVSGGTSAAAPTALAGTPLYMAPEQFLGQPATAASDEFSFAVALYWALYRRHPFLSDVQGSPRMAELARRASAGDVRAAPAGTDVPAWLEGVLRRALAPGPADRYPSMQALLGALAAGPDRRGRRALRWAAGPLALTAVLVGWRLQTPAAARCGDGLLQAVEECDDGNQREDDGCTSRCLACGGAKSGIPWSDNGACYVRHDQPRTFREAAEACRAEAGELVTLSGTYETEFLLSIILAPHSHSFWLGLRRSRADAAFVWLSGEPVRWSAFPAAIRTALRGPACAATVPGPPDHDVPPPRWAAVPCDSVRPFVCERTGWTAPRAGGPRYRIFAGAMAWNEARAACASKGARLLTVNDAGEQDAVAALTAIPIWLGVSAADRQDFRDLDGRPPPFLRFGPGEPDLPTGPRCLVMDADHRWYDRGCDERHPFMCEAD